MKSFIQRSHTKEVARVSSSSFIIAHKYSFQLVRRVRQRTTVVTEVAEPIEESKPEAIVATHMAEVVAAAEMPAKGHDESKRLFLRMAGLAGVGVIAAAVLPKKAEAYVLGSAPTTGIVGMKNASNVRIDPATETTLAGIKTKSDKLTFDGSNNLQVGGALSVKNAGGSTINPATEDTLALIKAQSDKLTFDGSNQLLTTSSGGGTASVVGLKDTSSTTINPASDDAIIYLRRMVKLMESQATVDSANRQRVSIDAGTLPTVTAVTTVGTVSTITGGTITTITNAVPVGNVATFDGYNRQMFQDVARNAYANGLRQNLIFS